MIERKCVGEVPAKHHIALRREHALRVEECLTRDGFEGPYTILYHLERPHTHHDARPAKGFALPAAEPRRPPERRHFRSGGVPATLGRPPEAPGIPPIHGRYPLLFNSDVVLSVSFPTSPDPIYFSNGDGDDLYYIHEGSGVLRSTMGDLKFRSGDYVLVPRGVVHRILPDADKAQHWFVIECAGGVGLPAQWRNPVGQLRMDAPFCHRDFRSPTFVGPLDEGLRRVLVKRNSGFFEYVLDSSPLDVVGWDGTVYPLAFSILDFQPRVGLVHLPPSWHGTFAARGALVCSFVPRPVDFHKEAIPCPYPHSSVDIDEVIFYCRGNFTSRRGVGPGSISFHPAGIPHGPQPGAYENSIGGKETDELAVMLDVARPLAATSYALGVEDHDYAHSF